MASKSKTTTALTVTLNPGHAPDDPAALESSLREALNDVQSVAEVGRITIWPQPAAVYVDVDVAGDVSAASDAISIALMMLDLMGASIDPRMDHPETETTEPIMSMPLEIMSIGDIEKAIQTSTKSVRMWRHRGKLPRHEALLSGGRPVWRMDTIEEWARQEGIEIAIDRPEMVEQQRWPRTPGDEGDEGDDSGAED